jgi:methylaspartate ammonia-lyase
MIHIKMPGLGSVHNSVEAVLACREGEIGALLGGSSTETDLSARATAHVALAAQPDVVTAKPGMGIDEGITILQNEMARTLVSIKTRTAQSR